MATHRSATATRNRVEASRGHIARCRPTRRVATLPRLDAPRPFTDARPLGPRTPPTRAYRLSIVHRFFFACFSFTTFTFDRFDRTIRLRFFFDRFSLYMSSFGFIYLTFSLECKLEKSLFDVHFRSVRTIRLRFFFDRFSYMS